MRAWAKWLINHHLKWLLQAIWLVTIPLAFLMFVVSELIDYAGRFEQNFSWFWSEVQNEWRRICSAKANMKGSEK